MRLAAWLDRHLLHLIAFFWLAAIAGVVLTFLVLQEGVG